MLCRSFQAQTSHARVWTPCPPSHGSWSSSPGPAEASSWDPGHTRPRPSAQLTAPGTCASTASASAHLVQRLQRPGRRAHLSGQADGTRAATATGRRARPAPRAQRVPSPAHESPASLPAGSRHRAREARPLGQLPERQAQRALASGECHRFRAPAPVATPPQLTPRERTSHAQPQPWDWGCPATARLASKAMHAPRPAAQPWVGRRGEAWRQRSNSARLGLEGRSCAAAAHRHGPARSPSQAGRRASSSTPRVCRLGGSRASCALSQVPLPDLLAPTGCSSHCPASSEPSPLPPFCQSGTRFSFPSLWAVSNPSPSGFSLALLLRLLTPLFLFFAETLGPRPRRLFARRPVGIREHQGPDLGPVLLSGGPRVARG